MSGYYRKKASQIHHETNYLFSKKVSFDEAFPEIEDVIVEVEERGQVPQHHRHFRKYTKKNLGEFIDCSNPPCYDGVFSIGSILREMVAQKQTELETLECCQGNEASEKGKRIYRSCANIFSIRVSIKYRQTASEK